MEIDPGLELENCATNFLMSSLSRNVSSISGTKLLMAEDFSFSGNLGQKAIIEDLGFSKPLIEYRRKENI